MLQLSSRMSSRAVVHRFFDDLDASGALDVAVTEGRDAARHLVQVLAAG